MRMTLVFVMMVFVSAVKAQTFLPGSFADYSNRGTFARTIRSSDSSLQRKWSFGKYAGLSTSFSFFKGGSATVVAVPIGLQVNRRLTNNLYAFAGVSLAPAYVNFNSSFGSTDLNKTNRNNSFFKPGNVSMFSRAELGLMYINPEKTFSISGSIGVERSNFPVYYNPVTSPRQNPVIPSN